MPEYYRAVVFLDENYTANTVVIPFMPKKMTIRQNNFVNTSGVADAKTYYLKWDVDPYPLTLLSFANTNPYQKIVKDIDRQISNQIKFHVYKCEDNTSLTNAFDLSLLIDFESD